MKKKAFITALLALLLLCGAGCAALTGAIGGEPEEAPAPAATESPAVIDARDMGLGDLNLGAYYGQTQLRSLDLRGNELSAGAVTQLIAALPDCEILWSVPIGAARYDSNSAELAVEGASGAELANLALFPNLTSASVSGCDDYAALAALKDTLPGVTLTYAFDLGGVRCANDAASLDLTGAELGDGAALLNALPALPLLTSVDISGQPFSADTLLALTESYPGIDFLWTVELYGVTIESTATEASLGSAKLPDAPAMTELKEKLPLLPKLERLDMCGCGVDEADMMALQDAYTDVKFIFNIRIGNWIMRTDVKAFSKGNQHSFEGGEYLGPNMNLYDDDVAKLKYCTDLVALDIGHGFKLTNVEVVRSMPKLRFLIIAMQKIEDLTPVGTLTELEYLETFQNPISDLSPLLNCKKLTHLNCSTNVAKGDSGKEYPDPEILKQMTQLKRLWCIRDSFSKETLAELASALPDCVINAAGTHSTSNNWRDNDLYVEMQGLFNNPILE